MGFIRFVALIFWGLMLATGGASAREKSRTWMGAAFDDLSAREARAIGWKSPQGAKLKELVPNGSAHKAGLRVNDILVSRDGLRIKNAADLLRSIREAAPGTKTHLTVLRNGRSRRVDVELKLFWYESDEPEGWLGLGLSNVTPVATEVPGGG